MIRLAFLGNRASQRPFLSGADRVRIGRDAATNDLVIDDPSISLRHCLLERTPPDTYLIRDLGSANGVVIGDRRVEHDRLVGGDRLRLGETQLEVSLGRAQVRVVTGPQQGRVLQLEAEPLTFGTGPDNALVLRDPGVAEYHAALLILPTGYELRDNTDGGGLSVNDRPVPRAVLAPGDTFSLGASQLRFEVVTDPRPAATILAAPSMIEPPAAPAVKVDDGPQLVFLEGVRAGTMLRLEDLVTFGRSEECTVQLNDVLVSGKHCAIRRQDKDYQLEDTGSTNGTVLNGHRLREPHVLRAADRIGIGTTLVEFRLSAAAPGPAIGATIVAGPSDSLPPPHEAPVRQATSTNKVPILPAVEAAVLTQSSDGRALAAAIGYGSFAKPWRPASLLGASSARLVSSMVLFAAAIALVALSLPRR